MMRFKLSFDLFVRKLFARKLFVFLSCVFLAGSNFAFSQAVPTQVVSSPEQVQATQQVVTPQVATPQVAVQQVSSAVPVSVQAQVSTPAQQGQVLTVQVPAQQVQVSSQVPVAPVSTPAQVVPVKAAPMTQVSPEPIQVSPETQAAVKFTESSAVQLPAASVKIGGTKQTEQKEALPENNSQAVAADERSAGQEIEGLDTVSVREPEGNWLLKRIWWEKAGKKYEKIKDFVSKIMESRTPFFEKSNELEKKVLNPFYSDIGLKSGQMIEIVNALLEKVKQDRAENITLNEKEREFLELVKAEESNLNQLETDINSIKSIDDAINQDLEKLSEQINRCRRYEDNAWQLFNAIAKELSHKKARELYYKMDALWQNVKSIDAYIKDAFSNHFDLIVANANSQVKRIRETFDKFKDKGIDLKKKYKELSVKKDPKILEQEKKKAEADAAAAAKLAEEEKAAQEVGIMGSIWNGITWPFRKIYDLFGSLWS